MSPWQKRARLVAAITALAVVIVVAFAFKRRPPSDGAAANGAPADPKALVESATGQVIRFNRVKEEIRFEYESAKTFSDAPTQMHGVKVTTERAGGRKFELTGQRAELGQNETNFSLVGDVRLKASDGMEAHVERASYTDTDGLLRAPGPIQFSRGRLSGTGIGLTYARNVDVLTIHETVVVHVAPDAKGAGATEISAGSAEFSRVDHVIRFNAAVKVTRDGETIEADTGTARLSADEQRLEAIELRGNAHLTAPATGVGRLRSMNGQSIDLKYRADGEILERAVVTGNAAAHVSGKPGEDDRVISADETLDLSLAPDGSTPVAMTARKNVELTIPGVQANSARSIQSQSLDGHGEPGRGLTHARFTGGVQFHERGPDVDRSARSGALDVTLAPGLSEIEDARFAQSVRFEEGALRGEAALARYVLGQGMLELTGSEPGRTTPQVVNERISVYGTRIDVTLSGPTVKATGTVKSELKPPKSDAGKPDARMPSMFKQDQVVAATAGELVYDGAASKATYTGNAQLWQGDTSIRAASIVLNEKSGDLTADGSVITTITLEDDAKDKPKQRGQTTATSKAFQYEEAPRRATYTGDAHAVGPQGDMTAVKIELYLKESGNALERAEAYDGVTLRDQNRETKGARMTYFAPDERYVVTGSPVVIKDECGRETVGRRVTYHRLADTVIVENEQGRTETRGGTNCR